MNRLMQMTSKGAGLILDNPKSEEEARKQVYDKTLIAFNKLFRYEEEAANGSLTKVVRCKNCIHRGEPICPMDDIVQEDELEDNSFCSFGVEIRK